TGGELYRIHLAGPRDFPRVGTPQPLVGFLHLIAVADCLMKDPVLVAEAITHGRKLQRCQRVDKTSGQATEAAVTETRVRLLFLELWKIATFASHRPLSEPLCGEGPSLLL